MSVGEGVMMGTDELRRAAERLRVTAGALRDHADGCGHLTGGANSWWQADFLAEALRRHAPGTTDPDDRVVLAEHFILAGEWLHLATSGVGVALAHAFEMTAIAMDSMGAHYPDGDEAMGLWTDTGAPMYEWDATLAVARLVNGRAK